MKKIASLFLLILAFSCTQDDAVNPFDDPSLKDPSETEEISPLPLDNFGGIYEQVLKPTCANSGCHDGTFEPDFRTMNSAYSTMVYHSIIKNDTNNPFQYRVAPGDADNSMLMLRLIKDIDGQSGIMPLAVNPDSDWPQKEATYEAAIRAWINAGALGPFGSTPVPGNPYPQLLGSVGFANGSSSKLNRISRGPIRVPEGTTSLDLWIAAADEGIPSNQLMHNKIRFSKVLADFPTQVDESLSIVSPITETGFSGEQEEFYHKITINPMAYGSKGDVIFFRVYIQDNSPVIAELPSSGSTLYVAKYMAFEII